MPLKADHAALLRMSERNGICSTLGIAGASGLMALMLAIAQSLHSSTIQK